MGIIKTARANSTGVAIVNAYNQAVSALSQVKSSLETLENQIVSMKNNSEDFTEEDWKEVETLRNEINKQVSEL